jgi:hypothetical protein
MNLLTSLCKVSVVFCSVLTKLEYFSTEFSKITQYKTSRKLNPVEPVLFHANGPRDRHYKANSRFCNIAKAPNNERARILPFFIHSFIHSAICLTTVP